MFSQWPFCSRFYHSVEPKSKRLVKNTGHSRVDRTAMITAPQNSIKSTKRTQNAQSKTLGGSCTDTLDVDTLKTWLSSSHSVWLKACCFTAAKEMHKLTKKVRWTQKEGQNESRNEVFVWKRQTEERPEEMFDPAFTWKGCFYFTLTKSCYAGYH